MQCPKCSYVRKPSDTAPDWQCPSCGVVYAKVIAQQQEKLRQAAEVEEAKALWEEGQLERLELAARGQKLMIYGILSSLLFGMLLPVLERLPIPPSLPIPPWLPGIVPLLVVGAFTLLGVVKVCSGLEKGQGQKILFMVMMFIPLLSVLAMLYLSQKATSMLRESGVRVGLLGAKS